MEILSFLATPLIFSFILYTIASMRQADTVFWAILGFILGPLAIPFVFFSKPTKKNTSNKSQNTKRTKSKSSSALASIFASIALLVFILALLKLDAWFLGQGEMHPFVGLFFAVIIGGLSLISYFLAAIGGIIALIVVFTYKELNILSIYSLVVFIIIQVSIVVI